MSWLKIGSGIAARKLGSEGSREGSNLPGFEACGWVHELVDEFLDRQEFRIPDFRHQI
jgi:hypothetical protein